MSTGDIETRLAPTRFKPEDRYKAFLETIMRHFFAFLFLILSLSSFGQQIDKEEYISITKTVLSNLKLVVNLNEYSHFDNHPVYDTETVFILDTVFINEELYVKNSSPKFWITNISDLKASYINYWLMPTDIQFQNDKIYYHFKTQSLDRQEKAVYISGTITIIRNDNNYQIESSDIKEYEFLEPRELECYRKVECESNQNLPKQSETNNFIFGNWQYLLDSVYYEVFFSDDTIYRYNEIFEREPYDLKYKVHNDTLFIFQTNNVPIKRQLKILDENQIQLSGEDYFVLENNDTVFSSVDFVLARIKESEYKLNDIRCWGKCSDKFDCYLESFDYLKYREEFWRRMWEYKAKIWGKEIKNAL